MRFGLQIDGTSHRVVAGADGALTVDAEKFKTKVSRPSSDRRAVQVGDKSYEIRVIEDRPDSGEGTYVLELAGERISVVVASVSRDRAPAVRVSGPVNAGPATGVDAGVAAGVTAGSPDDAREGIRAPMPGKIVDVLVKAGDTVKEGDAVLILEAMKMENELRAPRRGTVTSVLVQKGNPAERGQLLIALE
jgi:glutaconyl-CoA/methylmalonyl-CoA decarboxylase subunit gamma